MHSSTSGHFLVDGHKCEVLVDSDAISCNKIKRIEFNKVIGANISADNAKIKIHYAKQNTSGRLLKSKKLIIQPIENSLEVSTNKQSSARTTFIKLFQKIQDILNVHRKERPKRLLIYVNPFGGKGKALHLYKSHVRRLLDIAGVEVKLIITKYANHARDTIEDPMFKVEYFDGIACVGGDGMFSELMNGLLYRFNRENILSKRSELEEESFKKDEEELMTTTTTTQMEGKHENNINSSENRHSTDDFKQSLTKLKSALGGVGKQFLSPTIPIGVIGAGSTDANSFGLIGTNDVITATLNIILGNQIKIDICSIHTLEEDRLLRFVSTFVAYGYFGDVVRESEKLRWLGPSRYDVTGLNNLIKNRSYQGLVRILVSNRDGSPTESARCYSGCPLCNNEQDDNLDLRMIEKSGPFIGVNAAVTACRCPQTKKGFSPGNHLANGCADLILVLPCSRMQYIQYLLRTGWTKKSAFDLKYVEAYRCRQFEFIAQQSDTSSRQSTSGSSSRSSSSSVTGRDSNHNSLDSSKSNQLNVGAPMDLYSSWNVDGEVLDEQSIRVKVNNQLLRVFGTGEPQV